MKRKSFTQTLAIGATLTTALFASPTPETVSKQLEALSADIETYRVDNHIPGIALAIIKDDQTIFSNGFGEAHIENDTPVTNRTKFIIGSSTKSFSAVLSAMLVEDGHLTWDTPVKQHIPELNLNVRTDDESQQATIEDLLSHRAGFPRMSMLWVTPNIDQKTIFETASQAKPLRPFRKTLNYNNVLYAAGATAAANAADSDWASLIEKRIFKPLKMRDSHTSVAAGLKNKRFAEGYRWNKHTQQHELADFISGVDNVAPSGAIVSNLGDMEKWIRFLLADGKAGKRQLLSESALQDVWTPRVNLSPELGYGLGFFIDKWQDETVVHHGGNIQGYCCQVALIPEKKLGLVLMANVTMTPLQGQILPMVFEAVLTEQAQEATDVESPKIDYTPLVGDYVANFGPFSNTIFTVKDNEGKLAINVPGQMLYNLKHPAADGKWYFEITDKIAISFDDSGNGIKMYQAGYTFELPRKTDDAPKEEIVSRKDLRALMGFDAQLAALSQIGGLEIEGKIKLPNTGIEGDLKIYLSKTHDQIRVDTDFHHFGNSQTIYQKGHGEIRTNFTSPRAMSPEMIQELQLDQGFANLFDTYQDIEVLSETEINERTVYEVQFSGPEKSPFKAIVDQETGQILRSRMTRIFDPEMPPMPLQVSYHNYKDIEGYQLPHRIVLQDNDNGNKTMLFETVKIVDSHAPNLFTLETDS